jgi:hypothetical protein
MSESELKRFREPFWTEDEKVLYDPGEEVTQNDQYKD